MSDRLDRAPAPKPSDGSPVGAVPRPADGAATAPRPSRAAPVSQPGPQPERPQGAWSAGSGAERLRPEHFPDETARVRGMLADGREPEAVLHVMGAYRRALGAYFTGSSFRIRFPADENAESVVAEFFAFQMAREGFLTSWLQARSRFRYWLLVSFAHHMRHRLRRERSEVSRRERLRERGTRVPRDVVRGLVEAEFARGVMSTAATLAGQRCAEEGHGEDWSTFLRHFIDERPYDAIGKETELSRRQVANRVRYGKKRLIDAVRDVLSLNGAAPLDEVRRELAELEEALSRWRN